MRSDKERDLMNRQIEKMGGKVFKNQSTTDIPDIIGLDNERRYITLDLNSRDLYPHQIEIVPNHDPELVEQITYDARKLAMSSEYGIEHPDWKTKTPEQIKGDLDKIMDGWLDNAFDKLLMDPIVYDRLSKAMTETRFNWEPHKFIKAHTPNPTKRKASRLAHKARRNNRHG